MRLTGASVVIVGASGGIGSATARAFARAGANLTLAAPESERAPLEERAREAREAGVQALAVSVDVTERAQIDRLIELSLQRFGRIDVLVNLAGIGSAPSLCESTDEEIALVFNVNLVGCARLMHAALPVMKAQGCGSIVNVGSIAGEAGVMGVYSASKFGMRGLTDSVRREVRSHGVRVTLIEPGFVRTAMNAAMGEGLPSPDVVADAIVDAVRRPRRVRIVPKRYVLPIVLARAFPGLLDVVFGHPRIQHRLNRDARAERARGSR
ncbi:MAG TPA: SDR family oxidoreductase [Candidatus Baltobacteraceae bacterium]|nr:SDR family oxidoreductase [Candidatus Baltobacteraceae bacterium]